MSNTKELRQRFEREMGKFLQIQKDVSILQGELKKIERSISDHEKALYVLKMVNTQMQEQISFHIADIVGTAFSTIFENPYQLQLEFPETKNRLECHIYFTKNDVKIDPMEDSGGGVLDIASLALRIAAWILTSPKLNNVIILDEPFKHLSEDKQDKASLMLKEISQKLGIQFIVITHKNDLAEYADKVFKVSIINKISQIHEITN